jgi:hypothetical protein
VARLEFTSDTLAPSLRRLMPTLDRGVYQIMRFHQPRITAQAKTAAPWEDQTGNARNGLNAAVDRPARYVVALTLYGSVKYQIWLEVRFAGKYAVIMPTIRMYGPIVMTSFNKLLEKLGAMQ